MKFQLRTKFGFLVFSIIAVFASIAVLFIYFYTDNITKDNLSFFSENFISQKSSAFSRLLEQTQREVATLSKDSNISAYFLNSSSVGDSTLTTYFENFVVEGKHLAIYLMDNEGNTRVSTDERFVGKNYSYRKYFRSAIAGESTLDLVYGTTSKQLGFYFSEPVVINNDILGVLVIKVNPDYLYDFIGMSNFGSNNLPVLLTQEDGIIIYSEKKNLLYKSIGDLTPEEQQRVNTQVFSDFFVESLGYDFAQESIREGVDQFAFGGENPDFLCVKKIKGFPFYLLLENSREVDIFQFSDFSKKIIQVVSLSALGAMFVLILFLIQILRPLRVLNDKLLSYLGGNRRVVFDEDTILGEVNIVSQSLNSLVKNLKSAKLQIDRQVREQTKRIAEHTDTLEAQQGAILNILEDVEEERIKSVNLASDLEKFRLAVEEASDHIVITNVDGLILYANRAAEEITGFSRDEMIGKKAGNVELWGGTMESSFYNRFWSTIKKKKKSFRGEFVNKRKNGEEYVALASVSPVLDNEGNIAFFVGIERDITEEKKIDQAKTEFVSLASHQLRTPLSAINWYAEMLLNGDAGRLNVEQSQYVQEIYRGNQRMVDLVNSLLNVSRLELGTFMIEPEKVSIIEIAEEAIEEIEIQSAQKKQIFIKKFPKKIAKIPLDRKLTHMIFQNLLSNAVKYTPEGGKVELVISQKASEICIKVADSGVGIPKNQHKNIFSKLFRADNVRSSDTEGTGLGLYIIKSIVDQVKGKIWFESEENKGTTFYVCLPKKGMKAKEGDKSLS